jgi:hypothetical protein
MQKNRGIVEVLILIIGLLLVAVVLGFFNSVQKNWDLEQSLHIKQ